MENREGRETLEMAVNTRFIRLTVESNQNRKTGQTGSPGLKPAER